MRPITASMLYDFIRCPHRVHMDLYAEASTKDRESPFIQLLWEQGHSFEKQTIKDCGQDYVDLSALATEEKERRTREAMDQGSQFIYGGRIVAENLVGEPDLLRKESNGYIPGDIKAGSGFDVARNVAVGFLSKQIGLSN